MKKKTKRITLVVPAEFVAQCKADHVQPEAVLRGFIADLCLLNDAEAGYVFNGSTDSERARDYYERAGYNSMPR